MLIIKTVILGITLKHQKKKLIMNHFLKLQDVITIGNGLLLRSNDLVSWMLQILNKLDMLINCTLLIMLYYQFLCRQSLG